MHGAAGRVGVAGFVGENGSVGAATGGAAAKVFSVGCVGNLHTSVIEYLVRAGAGGVVVAACPPRDCQSREGVKWFNERVHNGREAELQDRVDRRRIHVVHAAAGEAGALRDGVERFRAELAALEAALAERDFDVGAECEIGGPSP